MIGKASQLATQPMCMVVHISSGVASRRRILQKTVASTRPHGLRRVDIALIFQGSSQLFQLMLTDHLPCSLRYAYHATNEHERS